MIDQATRDMCNELKMPEIEGIIANQDTVPEFMTMPFNQRFQFVIADLYGIKNGHRQEMLKKRSNIKYLNASFASIQYLEGRILDRTMIGQLATGNFMEHATDLAIYGATGCGNYASYRVM